MTKEELQGLLHILELDYEAEPTLIYLFYTTPDGKVNNFSISVRRGGTMSDTRLEELMRREYPSTRQGTLVAVERPEPVSTTEWLDTTDVCQILHISIRTLKRWTARGLFRPVRMEGCRRNFFLRSDIDQVLKNNTVMENGRIDITEQMKKDRRKVSQGAISGQKGP